MVKSAEDWERERKEQKLADLDQKIADLDSQGRHAGGYGRDREKLANELGRR